MARPSWTTSSPTCTPTRTPPTTSSAESRCATRAERLPERSKLRANRPNTDAKEHHHVNHPRPRPRPEQGTRPCLAVRRTRRQLVAQPRCRRCRPARQCHRQRQPEHRATAKHQRQHAQQQLRRPRRRPGAGQRQPVAMGRQLCRSLSAPHGGPAQERGAALPILKRSRGRDAAAPLDRRPPWQ
ncbi:hypothetical protein CBM2623_A220025 [Cupriavidus taiwanensis]|nr:hypothetical protein CBM2618_A170168 [Cupriavidus taiwanensis]SOZ78734.1 hypothetical protein CBM2622_A160169 [Cupriavidus taiwanensis]SPA27196.1 hypothetical protein CBM2623_A220025 [Cupriavidus taiwanensis]SPA44901.1 hypothetical protein CBM2629_A170128 [Cupriavidus taiwanensis]SPD43844.1 protein of unknown function [Cupriavidus taiwanensis]